MNASALVDAGFYWCENQDALPEMLWEIVHFRDGSFQTIGSDEILESDDFGHCEFFGPLSIPARRSK
jgi:hypothetical protein